IVPLIKYLSTLFSQFFYWTVVLIFTCVALKAIQVFQTRQKLIKGFRNFPGPPSHWLYGHLAWGRLCWFSRLHMIGQLELYI
uniref:Uncharacterized protein n=1 Tax=Podarcis muralis TaxID=64176 RepID=A0A670II16_PODMU